jgi:DNA-binding NarL/FixJ family response regulator
MPAIRIVVADGEPLYRQCLMSLLATKPDFEVVGEVASGVEAVETVCLLRPDVVLLNRWMPGPDGSWPIVAIRRECPETKILIVTRCQSDPQGSTALDLGASGYVSIDTCPDELFAAIRGLGRGQAGLPPPTALRAMGRL